MKDGTTTIKDNFKKAGETKQGLMRENSMGANKVTDCKETTKQKRGTVDSENLQEHKDLPENLRGKTTKAWKIFCHYF